MQPADFTATLSDGKGNPGKVTVAFTMARAAQQKGHTVCIILMVEAVELGVPGVADGMDIGQPFEPVAELLRKYLDAGGRIAICRSCMVHNGFTDGQMDPRFEIVTASQVIDLMMGAKGSLQLA